MRSIRRHLILLLISSLTLISFSAAIQGYNASMQRSSSLFDAELTTLANSLIVNIVGEQLRQVKTDQNIALQIWQNGKLKLHSANSPKTSISEFEPGFAEQNFSGQRWRVYVLRHPTNNHWIMVGQPLQNRFNLAENMILAAMTPLILSIPILIIVIFLFVTRALSPLHLISQQLAKREASELQPIKLDATPKELEPVITTLNSLFQRLQSAFEREQQFASNAAHELRTPLSVLKINLHNLENELPDNTESIAKLQQDTDRMINVVNQILLLSRTNPEFFERQLKDVNLYEVAQKTITDLYPQIDGKGQHISLDGENTIIKSSEFLLYTMLQNLISNACKYSPAEADIQVSVHHKQDVIELVVEDSGPGLEIQDHDRVLERFYRTGYQQGSKTVGSGLGLAIVQQILAHHSGNITLSRSELGGLRVCINLPLHAGAN